MGRDQTAIDRWLDAMPDATQLPFRVKPNELYTVASLYKGMALDDPGSWRRAWDAMVYAWTTDVRGSPRELDEAETVATRLHDAAMDGLVRDYLRQTPRQRAIGFMGGHDVLRTDAAYEQTARIARRLRRLGFKIVTGGGPGLMEAANLGAFLAPHTDEAFTAALVRLCVAPSFRGGGNLEAGEAQRQAWIHAAAEVRQNLLGNWRAEPKPGGDSLGLPTWYYGAEPPNLFASVSGKYFLNSVREDGLVSVANGGLVFGKGAAGTVQEVFQNATYNFYRKGVVEATPMVFLGAGFWNLGSEAGDGGSDPGRKPVFPLVQKMAADAGAPFTSALLLSDDSDEIVNFLVAANAAPASRIAEERLACVNGLPSSRRR